MGPLVPYVFSNELGLVIALLIGVSFGFILEQAGFSSTKKLVGLYYGYDFTVLRVFFTAGLTAMVGVLLLGHYGLLDLNLIYVNPTFLRSAIVGGFIMGAGFIIGGFCPGTSVCAAAIGKLDAMAFIAGAFIGVFIFMENYTVFEEFYKQDALGPITIFEQFGMSRTAFSFIMAVIAVATFYFTWKIENKVNHRTEILDTKQNRSYLYGFSVLFIIIAIAAIFPDKKQMIENSIREEKQQKKCVFREIDADKLAYELTHNYYKMNIIDVRSPEEFEKYHLPLAINIPFENIMNREWEAIFKQRIKTNVFYADSDTLVKMACLKSKYIGKSNNFILRETAQEFKNMFYELQEPAPTAPKNELQVYLFRKNAAQKMEDLVKSLQNIGKPVKKEIKAVKGGCS